MLNTTTISDVTEISHRSLLFNVSDDKYAKIWQECTTSCFNILRLSVSITIIFIHISYTATSLNFYPTDL